MKEERSPYPIFNNDLSAIRAHRTIGERIESHSPTKTVKMTGILTTRQRARQKFPNMAEVFFMSDNNHFPIKLAPFGKQTFFLAPSIVRMNIDLLSVGALIISKFSLHNPINDQNVLSWKINFPEATKCREQNEFRRFDDAIVTVSEIHYSQRIKLMKQSNFRWN